MGTVIAESRDMVSFAAGYPDPASFPWTDLRQIAAELLSGDDGSSLQYGPTRGHRPLIESIVELLASREIAVGADQVLVTSGSQQGLDLVARVLVTPGDVVLVELPAYTGAIAAFSNAQAELAGVRQDDDGINLEDLDAVCLRARAAGRRVNLLYLVPNFQNPTGRLLGLEKRQRLVEWAARRDVLVVEDDPYGSLYFEDVTTPAETRPLRAWDDGARVIYLSSFSKTLAPGFRVGWMVAPAPLIDRFETAKQSVDLTSGVLDQRIVQDAIRRGIVSRMAPALRTLYRHKRDVMEDALRTHLGTQLTWLPPRGGFFLWATLPDGQDDGVLLERAVAHGLVFVIGSAFYVDGTGHDRIRLSFSAPTVEQIKEGARRLASAMAATRVPTDGPAASSPA
jgi:2-aminoadipate transaminase